MPTVPGQPVDYLRLIENDKRDADMDAAGDQLRAMDGNPYLALAQDEKKRREALARSVTLPAADKNPDEYAGHLALAAETGLPVGAVEMDPAAVARDARINKIADTVSKSPLLQAWALQDDNAILAMDDFENLSTLERAMRSVGDVVASPIAGFDRSIGQGIQGVGRLYRTAERAVDRGVRAIPGVGDAIADATTIQIPWWAHPAQWAKGLGEAVEESAGAPLPEGRRNFATDVGEGLGTLIGQAVATRINPTAGTTLMAGQGAENQGERAEAAGATQEQQDRAVVLGAAITATVERMGLDLLLNRATPAIKNRAVGWIVDKTIAGGIEGGEEAVEQIANNLVAAAVYEPDAPIFEGVADSASVGAAVGVIARSLLGIRSVGLAARDTKAEQTTLDGLVQAAGASKLAQRAPERFEALAQQLAQEGADHVYVPAETVRTLYQSADPAQVAADLGITVEEYAEAAITGGDVAIPIGAYLSRVAPQHGEALRDVARFTPGAMTPAEAAAMDEQAAEAAERFMASVQTESPSDQAVYEDVYGMLFDTRRYRREDIEKYAQLVQAGFRTLAARTGRDAMDLYSSYRLRIKSELPVALQRSDIDTVIDPLIERLRAGDVPTDTAGRGQSLAEFLSERGGIADDSMAGEVRRLGESDRATRAGKARLVREGGLTLDYAREAAVEAGYLRDGADINDLLDALDDEFTGRPNRPVTDQETVELRESLDALDTELRRLDIDVSTATNADIKRALFGESGRDIPDELVRVFDQPAYHGTPHEVDRFSLQKIGSGEGAQAFGWGLYFASNREVAEHYRKTLSDGTSSTGAVVVRGEKVDTFSPEGHAARLLFYNDAREIKSSAKQWLKEAKAGEKWAEEIASKAGTTAVDYYTRLNTFLSTHKRKDVKVLKGNLYQVDIPDDGDLLDYDAPIGKQSANVQEVARDFLRGEGYLRAGENGPRQLASSFREAAMALGGMVRGADGSTLYEMLSKKLGSEQAASLYLHERGVPGLRFKAGQIAGVKGGGHNYVIWDEDAISAPKNVLFQSEPTGSRDLEVTARTKAGEFRLVDKAVPEMAALQTGGWTREIKAYAGEQEVGTLLYANDGTPPTVEVAEAFRRKGVATAMYALARRQGGDLGAADTGQTEGGQKSARSEDGQAFRSGADESTVTLFQSGGDPTQTPEFKRWFGDSKVVGADGKPLVVYRGESRGDGFDTFDRGKTREESFFFTPDREIAQVYANRGEPRAFYLQADKVLDLTKGVEGAKFIREWAEAWADDGWTDRETGEDVDPVDFVREGRLFDYEGDWSGRRWSDLQASIEAAGYDGAILPDYDNKVGQFPAIVVFRPEQIKSATANRGTFDPNDPSILNQSQIDEATGLPLNPDGTVTVYHHTNADAASAIQRTGRLKSSGEPDVYVTTRRETDTGYGDTVVAIRVDPSLLQIDDEFPDGRKDFRIETGRPGGSVAVKVGEYQLGQPGADGGAPGAIRRGYISFGGNRQFTIALLEKADATTFLHETGHFFLEVLGDLATDTDAPADLVADYQAALQWFGVESREQITVEHHEMFARGFEQYLGEGKAPTAELAPLFARFKAWVKAIYRTLRNLNVDLTDDVRGVFDRLLATDVEITQAENSMDYEALFADARSAGWTDAEFETRLQLQQQAREEAEGRLMARAMRDVKRETRAWWKEREAEVREQVTADVHARPVYQALAYLANGAAPDGTPIEGATKLDKGWLERQYGQAWLNKHLLRRRVYTVSGGSDPDVVATGFGYSSGDALVRDMANAAPMADVIAAETRQRMIDEYGDVLSDGTMPDQALRAVHGDRRFKAMEADLRALERLAGEPRPSAPQLRRIAETIIAGRKIRDVQPATYLRAERKAAKEAIQAAGRGEWGTALEAQRRRLLNAHLFDVASKAKDETEKLRRYVQRFQKSKLRALLGKIDRLDEVDTILDQYDLRRVSGRKIDQDKAKAELLARIDAGEVIAPAGLIRQLRASAGRTNWQDLTVEDFRGLRDVLKQIEAAAKAEHEAMVNGERVVLDEKAEAMAEATRASGKAVMPVYGELAPDETVKRWGKQALGAWLRPSALARLLDGSDDGAWTRNIIQPIRRAVVEQLEPMKRKAQEDLAALYRDHYGVKEMASMNERAVVPGLGVPMSRWDVIALALNWGNLENRQAILDSEVAGRKIYTEQGVRQALETLDARDWKFVQATWDYVDSYWPQIKETQRRRKGIAPPKVEADPFTITSRDGEQIELKGGYYPLKYNARLDARARQHDMDDAFDRMRAGTLASVQSKYGHVQERVGSGKQPVLLSMNVLHSHINNVVMDLALGDAVNYVDRVLQRPQVRQALIETGNLDALETWKLWLKDTATGEIGARSGVEQMAQLLRFGFTKSKIGFNAMTVVLQVTGLAQTIPVVGASHTAAAVADMAGRPKAAIAQVMAESAFMRARYELNTFNKDISSVQEALRSGAPVGKGSGFIGGFISAVRAVQLPPSLVSWAFFGIRQVQILVDSATWLAGYRKATGQGLSHAEAVHYADGIVENSQTSGMFSDRSAIERGTFSDTTRQSEFVKLWTTLGSYMIAKGNIAFESYKRTNFKSLPSVLSFGADMSLLFVAEALLMGLIKGGLPDDDDDESWWSWTAKTVGEQAAGTIPIVREVPSFIRGYGAGGGPIGSTLSDIGRAVNQTQQGEIDAALLKSYTNLIGTATGLPSSQTNRAIDAWWRESVDGEDVPAYEYVTGKRKE